MAGYIAVVHKEPDSDYGVSFPDFPGCISAGKTLEEAQQMAHEALQFHLEGLREEGEPIPEPSKLDEIALEESYRNTIAAFLVVEAMHKKAPVRVNATFDPDLLSAIDSYAKDHGMTRSGFLSDAAKRILQSSENYV